MTDNVRILAQTTHRIGKPQFAERNVYPHRMPISYELTSKRSGNAEQHLELITVFGNATVADRVFGVGDQDGIVGCDPDPLRAARKQLFQQAAIGIADLLRVTKRDCLGFDVDPLAQPDVGRPAGQQACNVALAAAEAGLNRDPDVVES